MYEEENDKEGQMMMKVIMRRKSNERSDRKGECFYFFPCVQTLDQT